MKSCNAILSIAFGLVTAATAQFPPLVGFTANQVANTSNITTQKICDAPLTLCTNALPAPNTDWAGGLAYNPRDNHIWHTQGTRLQELPLDAACTPRCSMAAQLSLGPDSLASGLTMDTARNELYQLETIAGWGALTTYAVDPTGAPCRIPRAVCRFQLPTARHHAGAIAFDAKREVFYVATSIFGAAAPQNALLLLRRGNPCDPFCTIRVESCLTGLIQSIRALAYDECHDVIYISDGRQTSSQRVIWVPGAGCPQLNPFDCCPTNHPTGEFWAGFDLLPNRPQRFGFNCLGPGCPPCAAMRHDHVGVPSVGNSDFALTIEDGPTGGTGFIVVSIGACGPGIPLFCGRIYPPLPHIVLANGPLVGAGVCDGRLVAPLKIPNNFKFCGAQLCSQGVIVCPSGDIALTNALEITIQP